MCGTLIMNNTISKGCVAPQSCQTGCMGDACTFCCEGDLCNQPWNTVIQGKVVKVRVTLVMLTINPLPNVKYLDWSKFKAFADDLRKENCFRKDRKHCGKRRKCWLPAFSPFPTIFFKRLLCQGR